MVLGNSYKSIDATSTNFSELVSNAAVGGQTNQASRKLIK